MNREPDLVSVPEAARRYGVSPWTYKTLAERGEVPAIVRVGRQQRVGTAAIAAHIASLTGMDAASIPSSGTLRRVAVEDGIDGVAGPGPRVAAQHGEAATARAPHGAPASHPTT